jgi:hypothetical protein
MDVAERRVAPELKEHQPRGKKDEEKGLVRQLFPNVDAEFLKNSVVIGWTGCLRVYSTLFDSEVSRFTQSNSARENTDR